MCITCTEIHHNMYSSSQRHYQRRTGSDDYAHRHIHYSLPYLSSDYDVYHNDLYRSQSSDYEINRDDVYGRETEINPRVYGSSKGTNLSSCQKNALDNTEEQEYQYDNYNCGNDESVCIIDDVETSHNQRVEVINLDCSVSVGSDQVHMETVFPSDDFIVRSSN